MVSRPRIRVQDGSDCACRHGPWSLALPKADSGGIASMDIHGQKEISTQVQTQVRH